MNFGFGGHFLVSCCCRYFEKDRELVIWIDLRVILGCFCWNWYDWVSEKFASNSKAVISYIGKGCVAVIFGSISCLYR